MKRRSKMFQKKGQVHRPQGWSVAYVTERRGRVGLEAREALG